MCILQESQHNIFIIFFFWYVFTYVAMYYKLKEKDSVIPKTKGPVDAIVYVQFNLNYVQTIQYKTSHVRK
jgi:hypothetical protein